MYDEGDLYYDYDEATVKRHPTPTEEEDGDGYSIVINPDMVLDKAVGVAVGTVIGYTIQKLIE